MYNTKVIRYGDRVQTRLYLNDFYSGEELKALKAEKRERERDLRRLELDILKYNGKSLPDFITEEEYIELTESKYSLWDDCKKENFIKKISSNRSKKAIYEICRANKWEYFITLTFNRDLVDSSDYDLCLKKVTKWLNNLRRKATQLKYIIVPELHKDGIHYHFHGLLANCDGITFVNSGHYTVSGEIIYNLKDFSYGFSTATKVQDSGKVSGYITKYITKELENHIKGKRRYLASVNCDRADITNLYLSDEQKIAYVTGLDQIDYMASKTNVYNTISYIEHKK